MAVTSKDIVLSIRNAANTRFTETPVQESNTGFFGYSGSEWGMRSVTDADIGSAQISFSKIANIGTGKIIGRATAGTGSLEELTPNQTIGILNTAISTKLDLARIESISDLRFLGNNSGSTASPTGLTADSAISILNSAGTSKINLSIVESISTNTILGNNSGITGSPSALTADQTITVLNTASSSQFSYSRLPQGSAYSFIGNNSNATANNANVSADSAISILNTASTSKINLARLEAINDNTILGNISGNGVSPVGLTADNVIALLNTGGTTTLNTTIVPNDRFNDIPNNRFLGNVGGGVAAPQAITADDAISVLNNAGSNKLNLVRLENISQYRVLGSITSGTNPVSALTSDDITSLLTQASITELRRRSQYYEFYTDFENGVAGTIFTVTQTGGGAVVSSTIPNNQTDQIGIVSFSTGTTNNGRASMITNAGIFRSGIGELTFEAIGFRLSAINSGAQTFRTQIGFIDNATFDQTDAICFEYNNTNVNNWTMVTAQGGIRTRTVTSASFAANTSYNLKIVVNAAATLATFYVNDVSVGTINTNIPTGTQLFGAGAFILKSNGNTAITQTIDAVYIRQNLTTNR